MLLAGTRPRGPMCMCMLVSEKTVGYLGDRAQPALMMKMMNKYTKKQNKKPRRPMVARY